jgi:hypothetical protein
MYEVKQFWIFYRKAINYYGYRYQLAAYPAIFNVQPDSRQVKSGIRPDIRNLYTCTCVPWWIIRTQLKDE